MPDRITRLSSMSAGAYCTLSINGQISYRRVTKRNGQNFIKHNKQRVYETDLPLGEEVTIQ